MKKKNVRKEKRAKAQESIKKAKSKSVSPEKHGLVTVFNSSGKEVGSVQLDKKIFDGTVNKAVLYQAILMYNANRRQGNASTKTRGDVSGGGKKPWRQKGTGRARAGSSRSPLWRGGGVIFGPHTRDFHYNLPQKIKRVALISSINSKLNEGKVMGIEEIEIKEPKTKKFKAMLDALKLKGKSLFVLEMIDENIKRSSRNLQEVVVKNYKDFSTMDVLGCDTVVMSKESLKKLPERVKV